MEILIIIGLILAGLAGNLLIGAIFAFMLSSQISREEEEREDRRIYGQERSFTAPGKHRRAQDDKGR